jgi:hypothetical protein
MQQALSSRLLDPKRYSAMPAPRQNSVEKRRQITWKITL